MTSSRKTKKDTFKSPESFVKGSAEAKAKMDKMRAMRTGRKPKDIQKQAGVALPVHRIKHRMRAMNPNKKVSIGAPVYMAAVLEYLCAEVLDLAGEVAHQEKKKTIKPRFIQLAISDDVDLHKFVGRVTIAQGGTQPIIHPSLLPRPSSAGPKN